MKTALLLIDIQNDYFSGGAFELVQPDEAAAQARALLAYFRQIQLPVVHIQHVSPPDAPFFRPNTPGVDIHPSVQPLAGETVITKHFPNGFQQTTLKDHLQSFGVTHLVLAGMMTHMCIDATTRAAKDLGFTCTVIGDACATRNLTHADRTVAATEVHHAFLAALSFYYALVTTTSEFLATSRAEKSVA